MNILSIDIGITNMGMVYAEIDSTDNPNIILSKRIDIKHESETCFARGFLCNLTHENNPIDWVAHLIRNYYNFFESANHILIEKQPPRGLQHIEMLIIKEYRSKVISIYPVSLHKWLNISHLSYEDRKEHVIKTAEPFLNKNENWDNETRKHDIADAACFILYFIHKERSSKQTIRDKNIFEMYEYQETPPPEIEGFAYKK